MFNRKLEVKVVKDEKNQAEKEISPIFTPENIKANAKDVIKYVSIGVISIMAASTILNTASEVIINNTKPNND